MKESKVQLRCPAGNLKALQLAISNGADAVYIGFESPSNLRNFKGMNFSLDDARRGAEIAHEAGKKFYVVINSYPQASELSYSLKAVDEAREIGADAVMVSDLAVMEYAYTNHPDYEIHSSVQVGATNAETINFYQEQFGITCAVLPRVLTVEEVAEICSLTDVEIEIFVMGSLCAGYSGRCHASQYITGETINSRGVCTSPKFMEFKEKEDGGVKVTLNGIALSEFEADEMTDSVAKHKGDTGIEAVNKQTADGWDSTFLVNKRHVCKGHFKNEITGKTGYILHEPVILNALPVLPQLIEAKVGALKIEGRQRPSVYSAMTAKILREAIDLYYENPEAYKVKENWTEAVQGLFEEMSPCEGAYVGR